MNGISCAIVKFEIAGVPKGKQRPRAVRMGQHARMYTPKQTVEYENLVRLAYATLAKNFRFADGAQLRVEITAYYDVPKSATKKVKSRMLSGELRPTKKPDFDNVAKIVCDSLNGVAYRDDAAIVSANVEKWYAENPRVSVKIMEVQTGEQPL